MTRQSISHWGMFRVESDPQRIERVTDAVGNELIRVYGGAPSVEKLAKGIALAACAAYKPPRYVEPKHVKDDA